MLDMSILEELLDDSRQSYVELGRKVGAHKDTVRNRVIKLMDDGVIEHFTISINHERLTELFPSLTKVVFAVSVTKKRDELVEQLLAKRNVYEVNEASPASTHELIILAQFKDVKEFKLFSDWLKSLDMIDHSRTVISPIYKQYKNKRGIITSVKQKM